MGASYLELVDFIIFQGAPSSVNRDLEELWRRVVFSIAVTNSDDHLRNHGFLLSKEGWELSPSYDINPDESADGLSLIISSDSKDFKVTPKRFDEIIKNIKTTAKDWDYIAEKFGIPRAERQMMENAFKV